MQFANIQVALGGDRQNTVPKYNVSAAEIAVLQAIHGPDAVFDIEPIKGTPKGADGEPIEVLDDRAELQRIRETYGRARNEDRERLVDLVYPLAPGTKVVTTLSSLDIAPENYKAKSRASAADAEQVAVLPPDAPGTGFEVPKRKSRARAGDAMLPSEPPGDLLKKVDPTTALGNPEAQTEDFLK